MAEDAEMIGGIKVSAEVTDAGIDQQLTKIEGKLRTAAEKWQGMLNLHVTATGPTTAGGPGGGAPAGPPARPAPSILEQTRVVGGGLGGGAGGATGREYSAYERLVNEALAAEQARGQKSVDAVQQATQKQRDVTVEKIQATQPPPISIPVEVGETPEIVAPQAPKPVTVPVEVAKTSEVAAPEAPAPVQISVDDAAARQQLTEFIALLKAQVASANEAAVIKPQVDIEPAKEQAAQMPTAVAEPTTQRRAPRRRREPEPEVYSFEPDIAEEAAKEAESGRLRDKLFLEREKRDKRDQDREDKAALAHAARQDEAARTQATNRPAPPPRDPYEEYSKARQNLLEERTDEHVAAFQEAAQRLRDAQEGVVDAQEEPIQQAPTGGAGGNVPPFETRETASARRQRLRDEAQAERERSQRELRELSYEATQRAQGAPVSREMVGRQRTPEETAQIERDRVARASQAAPEPEQPVAPEVVVPQAPAPDRQRQVEEYLRRTDEPPIPEEFRRADEEYLRRTDPRAQHRQVDEEYLRRTEPVQPRAQHRRADEEYLRRTEPPEPPAQPTEQQRTDFFASLSAARAERAARPPFSQTLRESQEAFEAESARRQAERQAAAGGGGGGRRPPDENQQAGAPPPEPPDEAAARRARNSEFQRRQNERARADREEAARAMGGGAGGGGDGRGPAGAGAAPGGGGGGRRGAVPPVSMREFEAQINARQQENVQRTLSGIFAGGRTGQVAASGISAAQFGTRAQQIRASEELRAARAIFGEAQKRLKINPADVEAGEALENAAARIAAADQKLSNLQGFRATARNIIAISAGSLIFSHAISAVAPAIDAVAKATGDWIDMQAGFASKSTAVTTALAQQTIAQKGNVEAVLAQSAATAGLSEEASEFVTTQLQVTTQVKAGALAAKQASDLFRATAGLQEGAAPQGLYGGFGGLFGSSFLAQQMGGGAGFSEEIFGTLRGIGKPKQGMDVPGAISGGVSFLGDEEIRNRLLEANKAAGANPVVTGGFDILGAIGDIASTAALNPNAPTSQRDQAAAAEVAATQEAAIEAQTKEITDNYLQSLTDAVERGGGGGFEFTQTDDPALRQAAAASAALAHDAAGVSAALDGFVITLNGDAVSVEQHRQAMTNAAIGMSRPDPQQLSQLALANERQRQREAAASVPAMRAQFEYERPAVIAAAEREQEFALNTQLPAQAALSALAAPNMPVGTGILAANAGEQERIRDAAKETTELQEKLNSYYDIGKQILLDTYQIPPALINSIQAVGQQIAATQAGIRNEQAAFQVAQYNNQLRIARRSLADIGGLTGRNFGAGQSYLGMLEKQNLALSRQAQLMQFGMQQRQINFQVALAGFEAPGVTPEERQARVKEAEIEAGFAQKQLNIQRQMFGNQVQIVDIQNLRQGVDLAAQINLLLQGRQVTIDTAAAEERLVRLQQLQALQVAEAGTYIEKVNKLTGRAFSEIQALETAAGEAMIDAGAYALENFGITLDRMTEEFLERTGQTPLGTSEGLGGIVGGMMPESVRKEVEVILNTANAQKQLEGINEQQIKISENVGEYLGDVTRTVTRTSRQVNRLEGAVGDALGRATTAQVNALYTYFTAAAEQWTSFFATVAKTAGGGGTDYYGGSDKPDKSNAAGFVGMTTGTTMTGAGVMGEAGQEAYAILRNPKQLLDFGTGGGGGGNVTIIFNGPVIREEQDMDKIAAKVMAATGREAALRGLRSVS